MWHYSTLDRCTRLRISCVTNHFWSCREGNPLTSRENSLGKRREFLRLLFQITSRKMKLIIAWMYSSFLLIAHQPCFTQSFLPKNTDVFHDQDKRTRGIVNGEKAVQVERSMLEQEFDPFEREWTTQSFYVRTVSKARET